ncbi:S-formylglutathione hydrolase-like isoform X3 [Mercenaria mercenaria]|uniref:S-formylglutathione hydrolase-like isoform X3 n=1 Tax=Mercenaria mercenaria TaxID=6596 RepID=UPI00234E3D81|nr:S-formylglutathione hydrolase-like isoform X3 [Mercenaria mercenaria]
MYTRAPTKLNSVTKYLCANFWRKRLRGELEKKPVAGNHTLCDVYPRQEILKISKEFQRAEEITQQHLEEEIIDKRKCIGNKAAMEVEDSDSDTEDVVRYHKMAALTEVSSNKMFNGLQKVFSHESKECKCTMKFGVYLPPQAEDKKCPVLYWLSGLTCTEQNFVTKAGAQRVAAEKGIIIVAPDTSPRGVEIEGQDDSYDFGSGAGFYVNATEEKWKTNYRMYSYITSELPDLINSNFKTNPDKMSIFGHSMGGHGALICAMKNPGKYKSVSAFSPISNPINAPWGKKAFTGYLGEDQSKWQEYDATELVKKYNGPPLNILIDQGKSDNFYVDKQLLPENLVDACKSSNVPVVLRVQEGYDHSYYFIATFVEEHINHHAQYLCQ